MLPKSDPDSVLRNAAQLSERGDLRESEEVLETAIQASQKQKAKSSPELVSLNLALANTLSKEGKAEDVLQHALAIREDYL